MIDIKTLKKNFEIAANDYLKAFCDKHEYDFDSAKESWVAGDVGTITEVGDLFVSLSDIRADIDRNAPVDEFLKWYDHTLALHSLSTEHYQLKQISYEAWLKGAPRLTDESLVYLEARAQEMRDSEERTAEIKRLFEDALKSADF